MISSRLISTAIAGRDCCRSRLGVVDRHLRRKASSAPSADTYTNRTTAEPLTIHWLDVRGTGLSMLERLSLEEALLRHDDERSWILVGTHDLWPHKYLRNMMEPRYLDAMIVMGIGGKPQKLLNLSKVQEDGILVCKRFSGGGTVVLDASSLWTTIIGRDKAFSHLVRPYPKDIMKWSADDVFGPAFERLAAQQHQGQKTLVLDTTSCSATENRGQVIQLETTNSDSSFPKFALKENDYVFGERKMGGNAQSIIKGGWLHHTSFLWDFDPEHMHYLTLPDKRPDYRGDRSHEEFLVTLKPYIAKKNDFFASLLHACQDKFQVQKVTLPQVMEEVIDGKLGGMNAWWEKNRTRIVTEFE